MSVRQYEPYAAQLGLLSENIHRHLTERECGIFDRGLADYHRRKNIKTFVECLSLVLNTNQKRQLLIPIRDTYVKPSDTGKFNQLVQTRGLATSLKKKRRDTEGSVSKSNDGIHKVDVKRDANGEWGFNIRGGSDQGTGVFVSWIEPESNAHKNGLQVGDQILKADETSFENINHHDAVQLVRGCKRLRLWLLSHGRVPSTRMAHKVYRWVDPEGRETSPPPDPFIVAEKRARGDYRFGNEADERKVTIMVDSGKELGISIRGGSEHGLGIYVSKVDEASVAEAYGIKVGDQILEVNRVSFLNIVHADAARALRAQPCMVIKVKDVGKLPHSRITTYGQTQWHQGKQRELKKDPNSKAFQKGAGTQVMLRKHETGIQSRGMMNEVARSVLTSHELSTFTYYIDQYEHRGLSVDDLATALLDLLDTPEKLQLLGEVRGVVRASDLDQFNELTIHQEIAAKKVYKKGGLGSVGGSQTRLVSRDGSGVVMTAYRPLNSQQTIAEIHHEGPQALQPHLSPPAAADMSFSSEGNTLTLEEDVDFGERDQVPQRMSPVTKKPVTGTPMFHAPPPPSTEPATSTPGTGGRSQAALVNGLKERRQRMRPGFSDQSTMDTEDGAWDSHFSAGPSLSTIRSPQLETVSAVSLPEIEARIQQELEQKMKKHFEEKECRLQEEHRRKLEHEKQEKEEQLRLEREALEQQLAEAEQRTAREVEERVRREAELEMRRQIEERERAFSEKMERLAAEQQEHLKQESQRELEGRREREEEEEERLKMELEERIWKEAEESLREEFESRMHEEKENLQHQSEELRTAALDEAEHRLQQELERKYQEQYEHQLQAEKQLLREREQEEQRRKEALERQKHEEEVERMEAEEQAKIELEDKIRRETEAAVRAEYEARLQFETEQRAHLAEEVKARKAAEERLEQERATLERERERELQQRQQQQQQDRERRKREGQEQQARERRQRDDAERRRKDESERRKRDEAERRERQEAERRERQEAERRERQEAERRERQEAERRERQEAERRERQEAERRERQEAERRQRQEAERRERQEAERRQREQVERRERQKAEKREREEGRKQNMNERQRLALERQQKEREEEEQRRQMQQQQQQLRHDGGGDTEEDDEAEKLLKIQREQARQQELEEEEEIRRQEEQERREREADMAMKQSEAERKKELQRKREENIRRREEEQRRKDEERRQRLEGQRRQQEQEERRKRQEEIERARNGKMKSGHTQQIAVKFGDEADGAVKVRQKARDQVVKTHQLVEEERRKAEEKLKRRMEKMKGQKIQNGGSLHTDSASEPQLSPSEGGGGGEGKSFGGYMDLEGEIVTVAVTKVCKKLGIAIDGGANTKQKAVIIREVSPEGCAAKTAVPSLRVGQQLLQVDNTSLHGLRHKETVMAIKAAFEGPMNKTITFIVLDSKESNEETDGVLDREAGQEGGQEPANEPTSDQVLEQFPEPSPEPAPEPQPQVQLRKKKRPAAVEERMREKGLDEFIAQASSELPSRQQPAARQQPAVRQEPASRQETGISFGGYINLCGEILTIPVSKVNKKLGMAIDGGANTKQKAITIRQITPDGSAALSGVGLKVGQQILQVNSRSLYKLSHSEAVATIKSAFEGPINTTTITFIVLDPQ